MKAESGVYEDEQTRQENVFRDSFKEQLQRTPWWLISILAHIIVFGIASLFLGNEPIQKVDIQIQTSISKEVIKVPVQEIERETFENTKPIREDGPVIENPVIKESKESDHNETANNEEYKQSKGNEDAISDKPFEGKSFNDAIGLGGGTGGIFGGRFGGKENLAAKGGGGVKTEEAVQAGLLWLQRHQSPDGYWDCDGFTCQCGKDPSFPGTCDGTGHSEYDPAMTGLALLSFLGAGNTTTVGQFEGQVKKGLKYLISIQDNEGCFGSRETASHMYNHAIATLAMVEAYALSKQNPMVKSSAEKAVEFLIKSQTPNMGWGYTCHAGQDDTSVMGWCVMALYFANLAGLEVPQNVFSGAKAFLDSVTDVSSYRTGYRRKSEEIEFESRVLESAHLFSLPIQYQEFLHDGGISEELRSVFEKNNHTLSYNVNVTRTNYEGVTSALCSTEKVQQTSGWLLSDEKNQKQFRIESAHDKLNVYMITKKFAASEAMTSVAIVSRIFMEVNHRDNCIVGGERILSRNLPTWGNDENGYSLINYYYWYHGTLAMFQLGGDDWTRWNTQIKELLLNHQEKDGCKKGSWPPVCKQSGAGGRIFATALSVLTLEIYYRYGKIYKQP